VCNWCPRLGCKEKSKKKIKEIRKRENARLVDSVTVIVLGAKKETGKEQKERKNKIEERRNTRLCGAVCKLVLEAGGHLAARVLLQLPLHYQPV